jgi:hypothetical protein
VAGEKAIMKLRMLRKGTLVSFDGWLTGVVDSITTDGRAIVALDMPLRIVPLGMELQRICTPFSTLKEIMK